MSTSVHARTLASMPAHARLWVYKSAAPFTAEQRAQLDARAAEFVAGWTSHAQAMDAWGGTVGDHFLIIAVDQEQAMASGCGIDKSVRFVQELERGMAIPLTDRMVVVYEANGVVSTCRVTEVSGLVARGVLTADTTVYDDLVPTKDEFDKRFRTRLADTWLARYL